MPAVRRSQRRAKPSSASAQVNDAFKEKQNERAQQRTFGKPVKMSSFPYTLPFKRLDLRANPHLYRPGRGEQGVLMVEPYKSELLPLWRFKDPSAATQSAAELRRRFDDYVRDGDFVGADMARKFIQMGFTRARRYANHAGGKKYAVRKDGTRGEELPRSTIEDPVKAKSAEIFKRVLEAVKRDEGYVNLQKAFEERYGRSAIPEYDQEGNIVVQHGERGGEESKVQTEETTFTKID